MKIVQFQGKEVVIGLHWHPVPVEQSQAKFAKSMLSPAPPKAPKGSKKGKGSKEESTPSEIEEKASAIPPHAGVNFSAVIKVPGNTVIGLPETKLVDGKVRKQKRPKQPSALAWLALANQAAQNEATSEQRPASGFTTRNWAVVEVVPGTDEYWLGVVSDQVPLPGTDIVGTREEILRDLSDLIDAFPTLEIYAPDDAIRSHLPSEYAISSKGFGELVAKIRPGKAKLVQLMGVPLIAVVCIILLFVAGLAFWGWTVYEGKQKAILDRQNKQAKEAREKEQLTRDQKAYEATVERAVLKALEEGIAEVQKSVNTPDPSVVMQTWRSLAETTTLKVAAWDVTSLRCEMETSIKPSCAVDLARGTFGVDRLLREVVPEAEIADDAAGFWKHGQDKAERSNPWKELPIQQGFMLTLNSDVQMWRLGGMNATIKAPSEIVNKVTMPPLPPKLFKPAQSKQAVPPQPVQLGIAQGSLNLTGAGLWQAQGLLHLVTYPNMTVKQWVLDPIAQTWTMQVDFYVRSKAKPVLPVIQLPSGPLTVALPPEYDPEHDSKATTPPNGG